MPGGTWTTPTQITGDMYVTVGTPFANSWSVASLAATRVGTYTFSFSNSASGTFTYDIAAPAGLASTDPAFGMPSFSGTKAIIRQAF